jgi:tripartite-type tricarboxylate transporter receptor subunit TctC
VVPAAAGGAIDVVGRIVGLKLGEQLGQTIVNRQSGGANNIIGTEIAARSPPTVTRC